MRRNPLEAGLFGLGGLGLAALINGCVEATPKSPPNPSATPINPPIVEIQPNPTVTPPPPSVPGRTPVFSTPEAKSLSELASLTAELIEPTVKSIDGLSYVEFMRQKGYEVFLIQFIPQNGTVVKKDGLATKILPDTSAQTLPEEYSLKAGSKLTSLEYIILTIKVGPTRKGEPRDQSWIARRAKVALVEGNPPVYIWVYNQHELMDEKNTIESFIKLINPRPTTKA